MKATKTIIIFLFASFGALAAIAQIRNGIPLGVFRAQFEALPANIQTQVMDKVSALEIPVEDFESLRVHPRGSLFYVCDMKLSHAPPAASLPVEQPAVVFTNPVPIASPPVFHSRPGSANVLFLDFNGAVVTNTYWNTYPGYAEPVWDCRPYSLDGDETAFSIAELNAIQTIWQRVAEDYAPFDIDVTTEQPASWNRWTGHVLITPETDKNGVECPHFGAGGVAFVDVFGIPEYSYDYGAGALSPAWVLNYEFPGFAEYEAEAASHEMGHNLALSHDGTKSEPYYGGHENGSISWGPIMGTGYDRDVSQWSRGEYRLSNNTEDDLAIIDNRLGYNSDDHGDDMLSATVLSVGTTGSVSAVGVIERSTDIDIFEFTAVSGLVEIAARPFRDGASTTWGGNLDIVLELRDQNGSLIASNNPELETTATLSSVLTNGTYFLHVRATGVGDPLAAPVPTGYTSYGSIGQYTLQGTVPFDLDLDGDGIPNDWETFYFGNATNAAAFFDSDGDGLDNWSEYIAGTIPTDPASVFAVEAFEVVPTNSEKIITWNPVEGRVYNVFWSDNLMLAPPTNNLSGDLFYPANSFTDTVEHASGQHFYRIDVRMAP